MQCMGLLNHKATKPARNRPEDIKTTSLQQIINNAKDNMTPDGLIFNFDQTGCKLVPYGDWTMA